MGSVLRLGALCGKDLFLSVLDNLMRHLKSTLLMQTKQTILRYNAIPSVVVHTSIVRYRAFQSLDKELKINNSNLTNKESYPLTLAEIKRGYQWL